MKGRVGVGGGGGGGTVQSGMELKQRVVHSLNKLGDRDTCQIGAQELDAIAESLTPPEIAPFLSCILDTRKDHPASVRKECLRLMAGVAASYPTLVSPYLGKMVATIVKRLKDPDSSSAIRDACAETVGALASQLRNWKGGPFGLLAKPLFEALGEQNKQVQWGSALCLTSLVRNSPHPPFSILLRMLTRTTKLLHNPHFMAKPPVIDLNSSIIIQAGGATSVNVVFPAMTSICEALKNNDWTTRKAASVALSEIASTGAFYLGSFKASCISSLESCRFDKVKPVRDAALYALQKWKCLPGSEAPEPSETGSSIKENFSREDYSDLTCNSDLVAKDAKVKRIISDSSKRRIPLSVRKTCPSYGESYITKEDGWNIEVVVPKTHSTSLTDLCDDESEGSSVTKALERTSTDITGALEAECEYVPLDEKQDSSSVSNLADDNFVTKFEAASDDLVEECGSVKQIRRNNQFAVREIGGEVQIYAEKLQDRKSLDSTITESSCQVLNGYSQEMACMRKQLLEVQNNQSNLMELLQALSTGITDNLCILQSKVSSLEHQVNKIVHVLMDGAKHSNSAISKFMKQDQSISSPRLSTCTPRSYVDIHHRPSSFSGKNSDSYEEKTLSKSRPINSGKQERELWANASKSTMNTTGKGMQKISGQGALSMGQMRKIDNICSSVSSANARQSGSESKNYLWQRVKCYLCEGDLDSAYVEAICSGDELLLLELLDTTGPILESLSHKTVSDVLCTLASYIQEHRFIDSIIPWLRQVVDLSTIHGPNSLVLSAKARREFYSAVQQAVNMEFSNPALKSSMYQLAVKLHQLWG